MDEAIRKGEELRRKRRAELEKTRSASPRSIGEMLSSKHLAAGRQLKPPDGPPPELIHECADCGTLLMPIWIPHLAEWRPGFCQECHTRRVQAEIRAEIRARQLRENGLTEGRAARMTLENFDQSLQPVAYARLLAWLRAWPDGGSLLFWSTGYGVGKTHLARAAQRILIERGVTTRFWTMPELLGDIRDTYGSHKSARAIFRRATETDLLILDDVGTEHVRAESESWLYDVYFRLIDPRYRANKPVFLTTNLSPDELMDWMSLKVYSRLRLMLGQDGVVCMDGEDYRMRG